MAAARARSRHRSGSGAALVAPIALVRNEAFNVGANDENYRVRELAEIVRETFAGCEIEYAEGAAPIREAIASTFGSWPRRCRTPGRSGRLATALGSCSDAFRSARLTSAGFDLYTRLSRLKS